MVFVVVADSPTNVGTINMSDDLTEIGQIDVCQGMAHYEDLLSLTQCRKEGPMSGDNTTCWLESLFEILIDNSISVGYSRIGIL